MQSLTSAKQSRGKNPGVVYDQHFLAAKEFGQIREAAIMPGAGGAIEKQQTGLLAMFQGSLGDPVMRKEVVEIFELHGSQL